LVSILRHVAIRQWWDGKCKKFKPPDWAENKDFEYEQRIAA
jgi:hypothetical protein